ncbi:MAG: RNA-guided pseudouridylation complex pseudouridine synthase subunit Cbf5 [Sulfolobaceae archaeon]|jgi:H/ACA ribonucleoprotein complex subunit 4|nr:RNA-guided pseudouridylation complex pseudouridine synthase subunit Cbf5 [Sulfolobaceae archaeon]
MPYISKAGKEYVCVMQVHCDFDINELARIIKDFEGEIYQRPPVRSSVKRRVRRKKVFSIKILEFDKRLVLMDIEAESGTYMRKICHDIGIILGCGSHMRELRRIRSGIFTEKKGLVTLHEISEALYLYRNCKDESELRRILLPMEIATCGIPKILVSDGAVNAITYGATLNVPGIVAYQNFKKGDSVAILTLKGELVAVGESLIDSSQLENMKKGEVIKPKRVIMERDLYPRSWKGGKKN